MTFHPATTRRERILVYGPAGAGKSTDYISIAELFHRTGTSQRLWLWDSDVTWEAIRPVDGHLDPYFVVSDIDHYDDWRREARTIKSRVNPNKEDWLIVDMATTLYTRCKDAYYEKMFGLELDEFYIQAKNDTVTIGGAYGKNWDVINQMYDKVFSVIHRFPGHVFVVAEEQQVREPSREGKGGDREEVRSVYGTIGYYPAGRWNMSHAFHTIIRQVEPQMGRYIMQGVKDRQRERVKGVAVPKVEEGGFAWGYLMNVAGWVVDGAGEGAAS